MATSVDRRWVWGLVAGGVIVTAVAAIGAVALFRGAAAPAEHTDVTVTLRQRDGSAPTRAQADQTRDLLTRRAGKGASARVVDANTVVLSLPGRRAAADLRGLTAPGELRFRQVLGIRPQDGPDPTPAEPGPPSTLTAVQAKVGPEAWRLATAAAVNLTSPIPPDPVPFAPFATLSGAEVMVLPPEVQFAVPTIGCAALASRPAGSTAAAEATVTACQGNTKYLLDRAAVVGTDVRDATSVSQQGGWLVGVSFTAAGQQRWTELSRKAYEQVGSQDGRNQVAIVVDDAVLSAPSIQGVITGDAQISGAFTRQQTTDLAAQLRSGALPVSLTVISVTVIRS